ncbi:DUF2510 domain-containing protein [Agromyces bauzanensis]
MTPEAPRRAGWYDDPSTELTDRPSTELTDHPALLRYWDGAKWSPHTAPKPAPGPAGRSAPHNDGIDEVAWHTVRLRAPDEHTTVPLPAEHSGPAASAPWIVRAVGHARRVVGGRR